MVTAISDQFLGSAETPVRPLNFKKALDTEKVQSKENNRA